jgi:very-short-patch-repair endonuclease
MLEDKYKYQTKTGRFRYLQELKPISRTNRSNQTKAESLFWNSVLKNDKTGFRFLRQKPLGQFILDFYCSKLLLAVEIDGGSHIGKESQDFERDQFLLSLGINTVRYTNYQIFTNLKEVENDLKDKIKTREIEISPFCPPLSQRGVRGDLKGKLG